MIPKLDAMRGGVRTTFDLYCYLFGSTILGMIALPADVQQGGLKATLDGLDDRATRSILEQWSASPRIPLEKVRLGWVPAKEFNHLEGMTLEAAAKAMKQPIGEFVCDLLCATNMATNWCRAARFPKDEAGHPGPDLPRSDDDGRQRWNLHWRQAAPARNGLFRPLSGTLRSSRGLVS